MKLIETEKDGHYSFQCAFTDEEIPEFLEELEKRPRLKKELCKVVYDHLVKTGKMTPHGEM